jgi:glycosyltransferase involved in cell wall biosynthesis
MERFINNGDITNMSTAQKEVYDYEVERLRQTIKNSNMVCTVSEPLKTYLIKHVDAGENTVVLPCSVSDIVNDNNRERIRQELNIKDKTAILYLGGTQKGQYLEELVIPFIASAITNSDSCVGIFITQNKEVMLGLLAKFNINPDKIRVISVAQNEVADYLTGMDMGLLLRAPSVQNTFSQPVKFGEYLSAGIPIVLEEGTGDLAEKLNKNNIGCVIRLSDKTVQQDFDNEVKKALVWYETNKNSARINARNYVEECYTWKANLQNERDMYIHALQQAAK